MMFNKRRKAKSESNDDRHFGDLREGSGSVVSVVSVVNLHDIRWIHLTTDNISVVSGVVSVVSLNEKEAQCVQKFLLSIRGKQSLNPMMTGILAF